MAITPARSYRLSLEVQAILEATRVARGMKSTTEVIEMWARESAGLTPVAEKKLGGAGKKVVNGIGDEGKIEAVEEADDLPDELAVMKKKTVIPGAIRSSAQALRVAGDLSMSRKNAVPVLRPGQRK